LGNLYRKVIKIKFFHTE